MTEDNRRGKKGKREKGATPATFFPLSPLSPQYFPPLQPNRIALECFSHHCGWNSWYGRSARADGLLRGSAAQSGGIDGPAITSNRKHRQTALRRGKCVKLQQVAAISLLLLSSVLCLRAEDVPPTAKVETAKPAAAPAAPETPATPASGDSAKLDPMPEPVVPTTLSLEDCIEIAIQGNINLKDQHGWATIAWFRLSVARRSVGALQPRNHDLASTIRNTRVKRASRLRSAN